MFESTSATHLFDENCNLLLFVFTTIRLCLDNPWKTGREIGLAPVWGENDDQLHHHGTEEISGLEQIQTREQRTAI